MSISTAHCVPKRGVPRRLKSLAAALVVLIKQVRDHQTGARG